MIDVVRRRMARRRDRAVKDTESCIEQAMSDEIGQQKLQEMKQRCATMRGQVADALRMKGGPESGAPKS